MGSAQNRLVYDRSVTVAALLLIFVAAVLGQDAAHTLADRLESGATSAAQQDPADLRAALEILCDRGAEFAKHYDAATGLKTDLAALKVAEALHDPSLQAAALQSVALMLYRLGRNEEALEDYQAGLKIAQQLGEKERQARMWRGISNAQAVLTRLREAQEAQLNAMHLFQELDYQKEVADCMIDLAVEYSHMGQNQLGADYYKRGLELAEALKEPVVIDRALEGLGALYSIQGDYAVALSYLERVKHASGSSLGDKRAEAYFDSKLASLYTKLNRPEAHEVLERGLRAAREVKDLRLTAWFLIALAPDDEEKTKLQESLADFLEISQIYEQLGDPDLRSWALSQAARRYRQLHDTAQAVATAEKAVAIDHDSVAPQYIAMTTLELGRAYNAAGRRAEAKESLQASVNALESWRAGIAGGQSSGANFFDERLSSYRELLSMKAEDGESFGALEISERLKARRLLDVIRDGKVDQDRPLSPEEKEREQALAREAARWNVAMSKPTPAAQDRLSFEKAARDLEAYRTELYSAHSRLRERRGTSELVSEAGLQSLLPGPGALLVEYAFGEKETWVFTIARGEGNKPRVRSTKLSLKQEDLGRRVEAFRKALATRDLSYRKLARELYRDLLGPIEADLRGRTIVGIVPDGPLWNLPFQALVGADEKHFVEHAAVYYAPSLTGLHESALHHKQTGSALKPMLAIGDTSSQLPFAAEEIDEIAKLYGSSSVALTGSQATEKRWKEEAGRYRVLHLATHGTLNSANPLFSYLQLAKDASGDEDGMLEAREIIDLNLKADLAVLSACETGRGEFISGEGVLGMSWAVLTAGTPTVVVSQWKVDSASTSQLMVAFHRTIAPAAARPGPILGKAEALRKAQLKLIQIPKYQHPFYWAGFEMLGDGY